MRRALEALVDRPIGVLLVVLAAAVVGVFSLTRLPLSAMPAMERPLVRVSGKVRESMEQVDSGLARKLEERLLSISGSDAVTTWCRDGEVAAEVAFRWGVGEEKARLLVSEAVEGLTSEDAPVPWEVAAVEPVDRPSLILALEGTAPLALRSVLAEDLFLPALSALPGAGRVELLGGARERTVVRPRPAKLAAAGLSLGDVRAALGVASSASRLGTVTLEGEEMGLEEAEVVAAGCGDSPVAVAAVPLPLPGGGSLPLGEVAGVVAEPWPEHGALLMEGKPTVGIALHLSRGGNALALGRQVEGALRLLDAQLPAGVRIVKVVDEPSEMASALLGLLLAGGVGAVISGLVLAFFVRQAGSLLVLLSVLPLTLLAALPVFYALGVGLNLVSLTGVALAAGMLVDAGVVVLNACAGRQGDLRERVVGGAGAVARAVFASTVTTAVIFVPALFLRHLAAALFRQLALAIMLTHLVSLAFTLFVVPVALARIVPVRHVAETPLDRRYRRALTRIMSAGGPAALSVAAAGLLFAMSLFLLPQRLLPPEESTAVEVAFFLPQEVSGGEAAALAARVGRASGVPGEAGGGGILAVGLVARSGPPLPYGYWRLPGATSLETARRMEGTLKGAVPSLGILRAGPVGGILDALPLRPLSVDVKGMERRAVEAEAEKLSRAFAEAGLPNLPDLPPGVPCLRLVPTPRGELALSDLERAVTRCLPSVSPPTFGRLRLDEPAPAASDMPGLRVSSAPGALGMLASFEEVLRPPALVRHQGEPAVRLLLGEATGEVRRIETLTAEHRKAAPKGIAVALSGGVLDWQEARGELIFAAVLGILLVFLVLVATYESFLLPLAIFGILPFAALGGAAGLVLAGQGLDLASCLGFVLLGGLAVNNGVLLVDRLHDCPGGPARWAMQASRRLRPVLVTTGTALATLAPVAFFGGTGSSLRSTLSLTVFAGLLVSTPAALFVLPPLARLVLRRRGDS